MQASDNKSVINGLSQEKSEMVESVDRLASQRDIFQKRNSYYYDDLIKFFVYNIPDDSSILEIGCGTGEVLARLKPSRGVGIDISSEMVNLARQKFSRLTFINMDAEDMKLEEKFDYIVISDTIGYFSDIQKVFNELKKVSKPTTRIIITYHNFLWSPLLRLAELIGLKMPQKRLNWLNREDIVNLLKLEGFDIIKTGNRLLLPFKVPFFSVLINKYLAQLPLINHLCLVGCIISRPEPEAAAADQLLSVSIVIPARNEKANIENAIKRTPLMGASSEIIFIEGESSDGTYEEIVRVANAYQGRCNIKYAKQEGKGKGDAVRKGFAMAKGDVLMILDADLTVPPEDLPKFYQAIACGRGEYINGSRLVYPMEKQAMRILNMIGNKFFSIMFSWLLGQRLKDTLCGTKVISRVNYQKLAANRKYFGEFDPFGDFDLIFGSAKMNLKIVEVPIKYRARQYGETNISRFKHGWLLIKMVVFAMNKIKFI